MAMTPGPRPLALLMIMPRASRTRHRPLLYYRADLLEQSSQREAKPRKDEAAPLHRRRHRRSRRDSRGGIFSRRSGVRRRICDEHGDGVCELYGDRLW